MVWILKYISLPKIGHGLKIMGYLIKKQKHLTEPYFKTDTCMALIWNLMVICASYSCTYIGIFSSLIIVIMCSVFYFPNYE